MANTVNGSFQVAVNLTTKFSSGTAGQATEQNNFGGNPIQLGASFAAGMSLGDVWSATFPGLTGTISLDLTNLAGVGGRIVNLSTLKLILAINCDPVSGHDVQIGPGVTDGLVAPFAVASDFWSVTGGMPGAGLVPTSNGTQPVGNQVFNSNFPTGWTVDATHKTLTLTVPTGTVANFVLILAG